MLGELNSLFLLYFGVLKPRSNSSSSMMYRMFRVPQLGFIGAGTLAEALTKGWVAAGTVKIHQVWASAPTDKEVYWVGQLGCQTTTSNLELVEKNKIVVLAAKPQILPKILKVSYRTE